MPKVTLTGQDGQQRAINIGHLPEVQPPAEFDNKKLHRDASFAAMRDLEGPLRDARVPVGHAWHFVKSWYGVESRSEFTTEQWCIISARLNACRRDAGMLRHFIEQVREFNAPSLSDKITETEYQANKETIGEVVAREDAKYVHDVLEMHNWEIISSDDESGIIIECRPTQAFWTEWRRNKKYIKDRLLEVDKTHRGYIVTCYNRQLSKVLIG